MSDEFFAGFRDERVALGDVVLRVRHAPAGGTPILLVHGHPRTGATWHQVAARLLAAGHPVVCPDLRGYGASSNRPTPPITRPTASARWPPTWSL